MNKFLHFDWLRAVQFFLKTVQKRVKSVQEEETKQAFWLVNDQKNLQMANQIFCFQIKRTPWIFLTALLTITHVRYNKLNNQEEMKYMCKVIRSDNVKRAGANGTRGPMRGTSHDTNNNLKKTLKN